MSKTWFITGTSSGFGRQMTELLLDREYKGLPPPCANPTRLMTSKSNMAIASGSAGSM